MVLREEFYEILIDTIEKYYNNDRNEKRKFKLDFVERKNELLVFPRINSIISQNSSIDVKNYIYKEFNIKDNIFKNILVKIYLFLCFNLKWLFASKSINIIPPVGKIDNLLIWPCNRKIRVFYFDEKIVVSLLKEGFSSKYFDNEVQFRLKYIYDFIPKILSHSTNSYTESILKGRPLARVTNSSIYNKCVSLTLSYLKVLVEDSLIYIDSASYSLKLFSNIESLLSAVESNKKCNNLQDIVNIASISYEIIKKYNFDIPVSITHGDLQSGNIWIEENTNRPIIIDWETNFNRSVWYDPITLLLSTRREGSILNLFNTINNSEILSQILINDNYKGYPPDFIFSIFILEDITFVLEDNLELPLDWGADLIDKYARQLSQIRYQNV